MINRSALYTVKNTASDRQKIRICILPQFRPPSQKNLAESLRTLTSDELWKYFLHENKLRFWFFYQCPSEVFAHMTFYTEKDLPETGFTRAQLWTMWLRGMVDVTLHVEQTKSVDLIMFFFAYWVSLYLLRNWTRNDSKFFFSFSTEANTQVGRNQVL